MDLFVRIKEEHRILLNTLTDLIGSDPATRRERMDDLAVRILMHMNAEEQSVYRAFEELDAVPRSLAIRHEEEHHVARMMMAELQDKGIEEEYWEAKLQVFRYILEHHKESEEKTMLNMALDYFDQEEIDTMTKQFEQVEAGLFKESRITSMKRA